MAKQVLPILIITLLTSCIGAKKFTSYVEPKIREISTNSKTDNVIFDVSGLENKGSKVTSVTIKSQFIPVILYWQWNNTILCEVNPVIIGQSFEQYILQFADSLNIQEKLQGRKLEMKLEQVPSSFTYTNKGIIMIFIVAYTISDLQAIFPAEQALVVSYKLTQSDTIIKEGVITVSNKQEPIRNGWKSTKKFTWMYIDQFNQNTRSMAKEMVEELMADI